MPLLICLFRVWWTPIAYFSPFLHTCTELHFVKILYYSWPKFYRNLPSCVFIKTFLGVIFFRKGVNFLNFQNSSSRMNIGPVIDKHKYWWSSFLSSGRTEMLLKHWRIELSGPQNVYFNKSGNLQFVRSLYFLYTIVLYVRNSVLLFLISVFNNFYFSINRYFLSIHGI